MGNYLFDCTLVDYTPSASSEDSTYPDDNLKIYGHLRKHYRALVQTEVTITLDFGSAKTIESVLLDDVNFTDVYIQGHADEAHWGTPDFSEQFTVTQDERVNRYKLFAALTAFNYQYMRIKVPVQVPTDLSVFRIGRVCCSDDRITLTKNPSPGYTYKAAFPNPGENNFLSGGREVISRGSYKKWTGEFTFRGNVKTNEDQLWSIDAFEPDDYIVFFENGSDLDKVYLCRKKSSLEIEWFAPNSIKTNVFELEEVI